MAQKVGAKKSSISIHALREEGDEKRGVRQSRAVYFYPRPPRGGRRNCQTVEGSYDKFLSTPSARRATTTGSKKDILENISIHALREEGDGRAGFRTPAP